MKYKITVYLQAGITYEFEGRNVKHAREIANRIITEGLWVSNPEGEPEGTELLFPTDKIAKIKIYPVQNG